MAEMQPSTALRVCRRCNQSKPVGEFVLRFDRRSKNSYRVALCAPCMRASNRERRSLYRQRHPDRIRDYRKRVAESEGRQYRTIEEVIVTAEYRADAEEIGRSYRAWFRHVEADGKPRLTPAEQYRVRYANNRDAEIARSLEKKRRFRESLRQAGLSESDLAKLRAEATVCAYCGCSLGDVCHVDHVVPLYRGGTSDPENLVVVCPDCNTRKAYKDLSAWVVEQPEHVQQRVQRLALG